MKVKLLTAFQVKTEHSNFRMGFMKENLKKVNSTIRESAYTLKKENLSVNLKTIKHMVRDSTPIWTAQSMLEDIGQAKSTVRVY